MNIDFEYVSKILDVFISSDKAHLSIVDLNNAGIDSGDPTIDQSFIFHMQILLDNNLISDQNGESNGLPTIGVGLNGNNTYRRLITNIRLTQNGHDFAKALKNKEVLLKIKSELKDAPFKAIFDGSQELLTHFLKKKLEAVIKEGE